MTFDGRLLGGIGVLAAVVERGELRARWRGVGSDVLRRKSGCRAARGTRLFDRTPRAVTLTDEGRRFHAQVVPLLTRLEEAATDVASSAASPRGRLRANADPWFARLVLALRNENHEAPVARRHGRALASTR